MIANSSPSTSETLSIVESPRLGHGYHPRATGLTAAVDEVVAGPGTDAGSSEDSNLGAPRDSRRKTEPIALEALKHEQYRPFDSGISIFFLRKIPVADSGRRRTGRHC